MENQQTNSKSYQKAKEMYNQLKKKDISITTVWKHSEDLAKLAILNCVDEQAIKCISIHATANAAKDHFIASTTHVESNIGASKNLNLDQPLIQSKLTEEIEEDNYNVLNNDRNDQTEECYDNNDIDEEDTLTEEIPTENFEENEYDRDCVFNYHPNYVNNIILIDLYDPVFRKFKLRLWKN
ncbi:7862_t:CDS:2 [Entrophospora sp. SA101]|nr:7862_t:CDS:2 [Entrophospora sp. SA101]CAJ0917924.1 11188_t:CDS:2 [Entrophospora sp. SA101]